MPFRLLPELAKTVYPSPSIAQPFSRSIPLLPLLSFILPVTRHKLAQKFSFYSMLLVKFVFSIKRWVLENRCGFRPPFCLWVFALQLLQILRIAGSIRSFLKTPVSCNQLYYRRNRTIIKNDTYELDCIFPYFFFYLLTKILLEILFPNRSTKNLARVDSKQKNHGVLFRNDMSTLNT